MSFLKELKEDLGQAMSEFMSDETETVATEDNVSQGAVTDENIAGAMVQTADMTDDTEVNTLDYDGEMDSAMLSELLREIGESEDVAFEESTTEELATEESATEVLTSNDLYSEADSSDIYTEEMMMTEEDSDIATDEISVIERGTVIEGSISSNGSVSVYGKVTGNITCKGKLTIAGTVVGELVAGEMFINGGKVEGNVKSNGTIKISNGSFILGNISATSAVVAGAVKGDIDVPGLVVVDGTAVVKGDIKSRSVQINNGAAIEGFCSQCYSEIDYQTIFDETFNK